MRQSIVNLLPSYEAPYQWKRGEAREPQAPNNWMLLVPNALSALGFEKSESSSPVRIRFANSNPCRRTTCEARTVAVPNTHQYRSREPSIRASNTICPVIEANPFVW